MSLYSRERALTWTQVQKAAGMASSTMRSTNPKLKTKGKEMAKEKGKGKEKEKVQKKRRTIVEEEHTNSE
ncbi:hypothetical protein AMTR_s00032p00200300 [Amborella trichopoda]|uniref:Uncharacterized protein n=1 Tax=Amborella trichopoda TaxID=13333 RepID=U5CY85_AMBTC|nr:hypothetical protein AMTR_s00032p00200300 [Amborella trichopoda]